MAIFVGGVLDPAIGVLDQTESWTPAFDGHVERLEGDRRVAARPVQSVHAGPTDHRELITAQS
ncbi:MAG: hypothetical protein ACXIU8_04840 [Alkalilacustris sp.]